MSHNRQLHKQLRSARARFYPADLHVHSPASADVRLAPHFDQLSVETQTALHCIPVSVAKHPVEYESTALEVFPPPTFYGSLVARRDTLLAGTEAEDGDDWAIVAITDHNVCKYACEVASHAWTLLSEHRLIIMPGVELSVTYPAPPDDDPATAHIICIFRPTTTDSDIRMAISSAADATWAFGAPLILPKLETFVNKVRNHSDYPAICIAAHIGSSQGVHSETKNAMLSRLEAAISRVKGEIKAGDDPDEKTLSERLAQLELERDNGDQIALGVLDTIGSCGFDALQVRGKQDETHYRLLHRFREQIGRAVPIVCSDAHCQKNVFTTANGVPHLKLSTLSSQMSPDQLFGSVVRALRLGETRFSYVPPEAPLYWIGGIEIAPDAADAAQFWPFRPEGDSKSKSFVLPLSRNLNCLIGGRGAGKSAVLEAVAFIAQDSDFDGFHQKRKEDIEQNYDYYSRSRATLRGCNVKLCWQFLKQEGAEYLPKKAVFASRFFDLGDRHPSVTYFSADDTQLLPQQVPEHRVEYYRLGQIEKQVGSAQLRALFDRICGKEIQEHDRRMSELVSQLQQQRIQMVEICEKIAQLTQSDAPLAQYAHRKRLFDEVNTKEVRDAYEEVDRAASAETRGTLAGEEWATISDDIAVDDMAEKVDAFFDRLHLESADEMDHPKPYHEKLAELSSATPSDSGDAKTVRETVAGTILSLGTQIGAVGERLAAARTDITARATTARDALQAKGLPSGSKDREAKKTAFEEAEADLGLYRQYVVQWDSLDRVRRGLVGELQHEAQERTRLRQQTAAQITAQLKRDLDPSVLVVEADAQPQADKTAFFSWLDTHFSSPDFKYRTIRIAALLSKGLTPRELVSLLLDRGGEDVSILQIDADAAGGGINSEVARRLREKCAGKSKLECEHHEAEVEAEFWNALPQEIQDGLLTFPTWDKRTDVLRVADILRLDEVTFDDVPEIRLNDRPKDKKSKPRPLKDLSPGQRCSAVLPILLLTGTSPIMIDQPEDNMDNRLIRQVIVNILSSMKLRRQVVFATHNANLPVLGDVEQALILQGVGEHECEVKAIGDLDSSDVVHHLTEVMEGGREAFQYRQTIYQVHWPGAVSRMNVGTKSDC